MISISIDRDTVTRSLYEMYDSTRPEVLLRLAGKSVEKELRGHFLKRNKEPNAKGWPKRGLWGEFAERTAMGEVTPEEVTVAINHPALALKVYGGTVKPKRGRYLALPAHAAAYAAGSPREGATPTLKFATAYNSAIGHWMKALIVDEGESDDNRSTNTVWYWLVRKTRHYPDRNAMPAESKLQEAAMSTIERALYRRKEALAV